MSAEFNTPAMIRLDLTTMGRNVSHALALYHDQVEKDVAERLQAVIDDWDFDLIVRRETERQLQGLVSDVVRKHIARLVEREIVRRFNEAFS